MNNLTNMFHRLINAGGKEQQNRMILDKKKTLDKATQYSYQGAKINVLNNIGQVEHTNVPALINPNKLVADYDEKIISVDYKYNVSSGTIIQWNNPIESNNQKTYWLVYLQDLTELAYFRANMRKCNYIIPIKNTQTNEIYNCYVSLIGPKQQSIQSIIQNHFVLDVPNYTVTLLVPNNQQTAAYFRRYNKFVLNSIENSSPTTWMIEAVDYISLPGLIEVHAREYYEEITLEEREQIAAENQYSNICLMDLNNNLEGEDYSIKPKANYIFTINDDVKGKWNIISNYPDLQLPIKIKEKDDKSIELIWNAMYGGFEFVLEFIANDNRKAYKTIQVISLL